MCIRDSIMRDSKNRTYRGKITKQERERFVKMKQHIEAKRHFYEKDIDYCTVCGNKKPGYMNKSK